MMKTYFYLLIIQGISMILYSCAKDEGEEGPSPPATLSCKGALSVTCDDSFENLNSNLICLTTMAKLSVLHYVPPGSRPLTRLGVYLHSDGGVVPGDRRLALIIEDPLVELAKENGIVFIAPEANMKKMVGGELRPGWPAVQEVNDLARVLTAFLCKYNLPADKILFYTSSGGSHYITNEFIHRIGHLYQGPMVIKCGGSPPSPKNGNPYEASDFEWDIENNRDLVDKFYLFYDYGTSDFLLPSINRSITYYRQAGFEVQTRMPLGDEPHCGTDREKMVEIWSRFLED